METEECIRERRSVRAYSKDPVPDETLEAVVELARFAPSWVNSQCVRYLVLRDPALRDRLAETLSTHNPAKPAMRDAPAVVVFLARLGLAGYKKGDPVDDRAWHMFDAGVAVQTFCLAAHRTGLGTVIVGYFDHRKAAEILDIPPEFEVVAFTPIGVPEKVPSTPKRREVADLLFRDRFEGD